MIWHDLECGGYVEDLALWRALAAEHGDPILDVGAGTGRVALDLVRHGHRVTALDQDPELLAELAERAPGSQLRTVLADARAFELGCRFALCIVPMQTIQLLGGPEGRRDFLRCAGRHLADGGVLAVALADVLESYEVPEGSTYPLADVCERDGVVYCSQPIAIRVDCSGFLLERRRETIDVQGTRSAQHDAIRLDRLSAAQLEREALACRMAPAARVAIPVTRDYAGSTVVMLRA